MTNPLRPHPPLWEEEPTDEELGWNDDIPVNCDGETEEEDDQWR